VKRFGWNGEKAGQSLSWMIRVVIDTNVLVSGILTPRGHEAAVLDLIADGVLTWSLSEPILQEYRRVLLDKLHFDPAQAQWYFDLVSSSP